MCFPKRQDVPKGGATAWKALYNGRIAIFGTYGVNWLTDFVRPKINSLVKREIPDNLWSRCDRCDQMLFNKELAENLWVCKHCQHHFTMPSDKRAAMLFDEDIYKKIKSTAVTEDPLRFKDSKRYPDRLKDARHKAPEAAIVTKGTLKGKKAVVTVFDFRFIGGSMGTAVGEALLKGAEEALKDKCAYITVTSSGGARMQEGILSLMQMPRSLVGISRLRDAGLPFISVLAHPTTGGVAASFASVGDINLSEPGATIGFAGARVIQQAMRTTLPDNFQTSEFQMNNGLLDAVVHRHNLRDTLSNILGLLMGNRKNI